MFGDNNDNTNQQPAGDNTPPPLLDTPISNDPPTDNTTLDTTLPEPTDPTTDNSQPAPSPIPSAQPDWMASPSEPAETPATPTATDDQNDDKADDFMQEPAQDSPSGPNSNDLLDIKQQALQQLTPLVNHLQQSPKEEFRTAMMMIQATDNSDLIKKAFEAAQKIEDDKERAQAFLDLINEINYFTQHHQE